MPFSIITANAPILTGKCGHDESCRDGWQPYSMELQNYAVVQSGDEEAVRKMLADEKVRLLSEFCPDYFRKKQVYRSRSLSLLPR